MLMLLSGIFRNRFIGYHLSRFPYVGHQRLNLDCCSVRAGQLELEPTPKFLQPINQCLSRSLIRSESFPLCLSVNTNFA
jgi:hypothetical protein